MASSQTIKDSLISAVQAKNPSLDVTKVLSMTCYYVQFQTRFLHLVPRLKVYKHYTQY